MRLSVMLATEPPVEACEGVSRRFSHLLSFFEQHAATASSCSDIGERGDLDTVRSRQNGVGRWSLAGRFGIFGSGGFGRELIGPALTMLGQSRPEDRRELVFVADEPGPPIEGIPQIAPDELCEDDEVVIAIGDSALRRRVSERLKSKTGHLRAPSAIVGFGVQLGEGAVLCDYTILTADVRIGRHFQCNIYSYVAHDCVIGDFVTFAPKVCCNGNVHIEDGCYIGTGAVLRQGTSSQPLVIGAGAVVGMGAIVTKNVPAGATVVGNPARPLAS
jgi:sugar O-acyltransferase (sialic acid O-acetyltransferase NeuD family)